MPGQKLVPGDYRMDGQYWPFVKCMDTGRCYPVRDGTPDLTSPFSGLHELVRSCHALGISSSGHPRSFSVKGVVRFLSVFLGVWEQRGKPIPFASPRQCPLSDHALYFFAGFGNDDFMLPHDIPRLTEQQLEVAGPQPDHYSPDLVFPCQHAPPSPRAPVLRKRACPVSQEVDRETAPDTVTKRARSRATESRAQVEVQPSRTAGQAKKQLGNKRVTGMDTLIPNSRHGKGRTGFSKPTFQQAELMRKRQFKPNPNPSWQPQQTGGFGARMLPPRSHPQSGVLFQADFTDSRFLLVSSADMRQRELEGVVDDLYDSQVMQHPDSIRMLQRWLRAVYEGGDRAITRIRHDWGEPPLPAPLAFAPPLREPAAGAGAALSPRSLGRIARNIPLGSWPGARQDALSSYDQDGLLGPDDSARNFDTVKRDQVSLGPPQFSSLAQDFVAPLDSRFDESDAARSGLLSAITSLARLLREAGACQDLDTVEASTSASSGQGRDASHGV